LSSEYINYFPGMTERDVFNAGCDGYDRGWKNIPPMLIAMEKQRSKDYRGYATIWMQGWKWQKLMTEPVGMDGL
jgi:hypothetical protein